MTVETGSSAPDFTLFSEGLKPFTLSDQRGKKVVLLFFPGAFSGVCTNELNMVTNDIAEYGDNTVIVGISTDSPFALKEFRKANQFAVDLLSDHNASVCATYGVKYNNDFTDMKLDRIAKRAAFVINESGTVVYAEETENAGVLPDMEAIKAVCNA